MRIRFTALMVLAFVVLSFSTLVFGEEKAKQEAATSFTVARLVVGTGVENREPVGVAETFPASTERVYCFLEATNIKENTSINFVWYLNNTEVAKVDLQLNQGIRWRTYSSKSINGQTGNWRIEIKDMVGNTVSSVSFKVE